MFLEYFIFSGLLGIITLFSRHKRINILLVTLFLALEAVMGVFAVSHVGEHFLKYFYFDSVGALFFLILLLLSYAAFFHSGPFLKRHPVTIEFESRYLAALMFLITAMAGAYFSDNLAILWVFTEATTLVMAILILYKKTSFSLEAAWKYLFIASIGLAIAFIGILILSGLTDGHLNITEIVGIAATIRPVWLEIVFVLILTGMSVKMESFPFFPVCIDALGIAPSPVSALMSTALMNVGLIAIIRMYTLMAPTVAFPWAKNVLLIMGIFSLIIASYRIFKVKFMERLLAFSSLEHVGIILIALSLGKLGFYAAMLHIVFHSLIKSGLFFQTDQINHIYHTHKLRKIGDYFKYNQWGAIIFLLSFLCIVAIPPSGLFLSEFLMIKAMIAGKHFVAMIAVLFFLTVIIYSLGKNVLHLLFTDEDDYSPHGKIEVNHLENLVPLALLVLMIYLAFIQPPFFMQLIQNTVTGL